MHGFGVIAAWEVGQLDEATVDAYLTVQSEMRAAAVAKAEIEAAQARIRSEHNRR